jgi:hypothetical protein
MWDVGMIALFILLTVIMVGISGWAGKVVDEGSAEK